MSYSQYSRSNKDYQQQQLNSKDNTTMEEDNSQSGSFNIFNVMASTTRHTRRMGTVQSRHKPLRMSRGEVGTPMGQNSAASSGFFSQTKANNHFSVHSSRPALKPIPINDFHTHGTPTQNCNTNGNNNNNRFVGRNPSTIFEGEDAADSASSPKSNNDRYRYRSHSQPPPESPRLVTNVPPSHRSPPTSPRRKPDLTTTRQKTSFQNNSNNEHEIITVLDKPYTVLKVMGKGGSSVVYEAFDEDRNLRAIKKVDLKNVDEAEAQGYLNEVTMLQKLQGHQRIIRMFAYEYCKSQNLLYVVMERGDVDLSTFLKQNRLTDVKRKYYWSEMLEAVQVIHDNGIIHSDLKPANFLLVGGTLKLIDFGIASSVQCDKTSVIKDNQMGTFNFMSPEAIEDLSTEDDIRRGDEGHKPRIKISRKSDIWSLGCILYNLTYGRMPFGEFKQPLMKLQAIINPSHKIPYPEHHDSQLIDTIQRCLVRDPQKRASVEELLQHPYLEATSSRINDNSEQLNPKNNVEQLLASLGGVLTPNTKKGLARAMQKMSTSDSSSPDINTKQWDI